MKWPLVPTILVALAVATMIGLGIWQLQRKGEREMLLRQVSMNVAKPAISYPKLGPIRSVELHRKSSVNCLRVAQWREDSGKDKDERPGTRYLADCVTGADGPGILIVAGISDRPNMTVEWNGGQVEGVITTEPDRRPLISKLFGPKIVLRPMLISNEGLGGLRTSKGPSLDEIRKKADSNLLYAIQWFIFAGAAAIIYILALRKRTQAT
jgi:surfeit locus 1 family protein